jgi:hypothetical protein
MPVAYQILRLEALAQPIAEVGRRIYTKLSAVNSGSVKFPFCCILVDILPEAHFTSAGLRTKRVKILHFSNNMKSRLE